MLFPVPINDWVILDTYDRDYRTLSNAAKAQVLDCLRRLKVNQDDSALDLRPVLDKRDVYSVRVNGSLRLSFKYYPWGQADLREIQLDETLESDP